MVHTTNAYQRGLSLIELMVAVTIGLLLLAGVLTVVTSSSRSYEELNKTSRQLENGRYALELLKNDLEHAGFYGSHHDIAPPPASLPDPCLTTIAALEAAMPLSIQGYDAPASASGFSCLDDANHLSGTDILVVRRTSTQNVALGSLTPNGVYLQSNGEDLVLAAEDGNSANDSGTWNLQWRDWDVSASSSFMTAAPVRPYLVHIYFISPCSRPSGANCDATADDGNPIPTLKRLELTATAGGPAFNVVPLVEGIENLQIDYGLDTDGDGAPNGSYTTAPADTTAWSNVVTSRVSILARNIQPSAGHSDDKSYSLGLTSVGAANDAYRRHVYTAVFRVVNPSSRRE